MIVYKSRFLTRAEVWFDDHVNNGFSKGVDWILYRHCSRPVPGTRWRHFSNLSIDLTQSPEELMAQMSVHTAYKIRRARDREKVICERCDVRDRAVLDQYEQMYNRFATQRGLAFLDRGWFDSLAATGALRLSVARDSSGTPLVFHTIYQNASRASSLEAVSLYKDFSDSAARNALGRAHRYLVWYDLLRCKEQGIQERRIKPCSKSTSSKEDLVDK